EQPHLVAVPHRPDARAHDGLLLVVLRNEGIQHARAQVESVKHEVAGDEHEDQEEPKSLEERDIHGYFPSFAATGASATRAGTASAVALTASEAVAASSASTTGPSLMKRPIVRAHATTRNAYTAKNSTTAMRSPQSHTH